MSALNIHDFFLELRSLRASAGHILRIGVTGGIGSGKSLVCAMFARRGIPVLSADEIAKRLMRVDPRLHKELASLLGPSAYSHSGKLDRKYVAARIFSEPVLKRKVNALVHPRVEAELDKRFMKLARSGKKIGIVEAALIFEVGYDKELDLVIVVDAPEASRIKRVVARDKTKAAEVRKRMRAQWSASLKARRADYVIHNVGTRKELEQSVRFLITLLKDITSYHE